MRMMGMGKKEDYYIMRKKNGFLAALDRKMFLHTWSLTTGSHLYMEKVKDLEIEGYEPVKFHVKDTNGL
jgi:hypothetical protein